ncbi:MAG: exodeoxyribonuclease VII large subunit, partial [Chthoniobacteraceae bacterium]
TPSAAAELVAPDAGEMSQRFAQWQARMNREIVAWVRRARERLEVLASSALMREPRLRLEAANQQLDGQAEALDRVCAERMRELELKLAGIASRLDQQRPHQRLALSRQVHQELHRRLTDALERQMQYRTIQLDRGRDQLRLLSPEATLQRGYSITRLADGRVVRVCAQAEPGSVLHTRLADGEIRSVIPSPKP